MKNKFTLIFSILAFLFFISCDKEETRVPDFLKHFATVIKTESSIAFQLDNKHVLIPKNVPNLNLKEDDRVILNYTPLANDSIAINTIQLIYLGNIKAIENPNKQITSPIKNIKMWVSGNYLNMFFHVDYHSRKHTPELYRDMLEDEPTLYFSYSRDDDPPGAPTLTYLSFRLDELQGKHFTVYINTCEEKIKFDF